MLKNEKLKNVLIVLSIVLIFSFFYKAYPFIINFYYGLLYSENVEETIKQNVKKECLK